MTSIAQRTKEEMQKPGNMTHLSCQKISSKKKKCSYSTKHDPL